MEMYVAGQWRSVSVEDPVTNPYSGDLVDTVPRARAQDLEDALDAAVQGSRAMRRLTAYERLQIMNRAADLVATAVEELARTISAEEGKPLVEARGEADPRADPALRQRGRAAT